MGFAISSWLVQLQPLGPVFTRRKPTRVGLREPCPGTTARLQAAPNNRAAGRNTQQLGPWAPLPCGVILSKSLTFLCLSLKWDSLP